VPSVNYFTFVAVVFWCRSCEPQTGRAIILRGGSNCRRFGGGFADRRHGFSRLRGGLQASPNRRWRLFVTTFTERMQEIEHPGFATVDVSGR
jgi:hypothetical protein